MNKNTGTLIGLGVGPGDPELMTLKAVRILQQVKILAVPAKEPESSTAFQIAKKAVPEISENHNGTELSHDERSERSGSGDAR